MFGGDYTPSSKPGESANFAGHSEGTARVQAVGIPPDAARGRASGAEQHSVAVSSKE
jgi:hypothetical protein